jgi:hypothetical protein
MPDSLPRSDMARLLADRALPSITRWHRVEGIPRTHDLDRPLRAEVRDALWMLARQWQMGEFHGDDAGSPVLAKLSLATSKLTALRPGDGEEQPFNDGQSLEACIERQSIPFTASSEPLSLDLRLIMGRHWSKLLAKNGFVAYMDSFRKAFPIQLPDPEDSADAITCAHREAWQHRVAFAGRAMDGYLFYRWLIDPPALRDLTLLPRPLSIQPADHQAILTLSDRFIVWFEHLINQPKDSGESAWDPSRLEYRFACSAPSANGRLTLTASEYYRGELDWHSFDVGPADPSPPVRPEVQSVVTTTFIPVAVEFRGMANTRWWTFEDRRVNFGGIRPDTTDLAKLLLMEFGLVHANDWCVVPVPVEFGTVVKVAGMAVSSVFGDRQWIEPAGRASEHWWQRWHAFSLTHSGDTTLKPEQTLLMLPSVPKVQEGPVIEEVAMIRDEMANMVWAIEITVPMPQGEGRSGSAAALETARFHRALVNGEPLTSPLTNAAQVRYDVMSSVPENWIPFIPVHVTGSSREIELQRASMPRVIENDLAAPQRIKPRTSLMRYGLERPNVQSYFVHEEEVPRTGIRVRQAYQRTRLLDGRVVAWLGAKKQVGRGEGASGLEFDQLIH